MLVIVPSRGRPDSIVPLVQSFTDTGATADLLIAVDQDDPTLGEYIDQCENLAVGLQIRERLRLAGTLNHFAKIAANNYHVITFMGDDHRPRSQGWDARFVECLSAGAGIVYGNDLLVGERFPTAVAMTSDIVSTLGYMCPPGFVHLCLDLVWKDWGLGMGRLTYLADVVIEHMHPAVSKAPLDATYEDVNSQTMVAADSAAYYAYRDNGGLAADLVKLKELL